MMNMIIFTVFILNQFELNISQENNQWQNFWDLMINFGNENCPRCETANGCYAECDSNRMREFTGISNWANCKDKCLSLGGDFAYEFDTWDSDRGCAMYSQRDLGKCVCVPGNQMACRNIASGRENCPRCGTIFGKGAPRCLAECDKDKRREFSDIADWDDCKDKCKSLGDDYTYKFGTWNSDRACAIYAQYDNMGTQGLCVCVEGDKMACDNTEHFDAPPAILPPDMDAPSDINTPEMPKMPVHPAPENGPSFDLIEGYGIGVVSTLMMLLIGLFVACLCRRSKYNANAKINSKIDMIPDSEDEQFGVI